MIFLSSVTRLRIDTKRQCTKEHFVVADHPIAKMEAFAFYLGLTIIVESVKMQNRDAKASILEGVL